MLRLYCTDYILFLEIAQNNIYLTVIKENLLVNEHENKQWQVSISMIRLAFGVTEFNQESLLDP